MILFLFWILVFVLKEKIPDVNLMTVFEHDHDYEYRYARNGKTESSRLANYNFLWIGLVGTVFGLYIFNVGLTKGLSALGFQVGSMVPRLFIDKPIAWGRALYNWDVGIQIMLVLAFFLGYGATVAEPALEILGSEVEVLSKKKFTKRLLVHSISFGVGIGSLLGLARIAFHIPIIYFLLPLYWLAIVLTYFSTDAILHIAWDAAAVTTGPVTVPLILGIGIAVATEVKAEEGFGILALASCCPIISTLATGLITQIPLVESYIAGTAAVVEHEEAEHEMDSLLHDDDGKMVELESYGSTDEPPKLEELKERETNPYKGVGEIFVL